MNIEKVHKDAATLGDIITRILFMQYTSLPPIMTIFGYMVCTFIKAVAKMQEHDADKEMAKFIDYLTEIYAQEKKAQQSDNKEACIIKLN